MAEGGIVGGLFDGAGEEEAASEAAIAALDPAAAAAAMMAAESNTVLADEAAAYFRKQGHLVDIQTEHLHEQREVMLSHLKLRQFSDRLKAGMQIFFALVATALGGGFVVMIYEAVQSHSVIIESFSAPPALAARGISGTVVAQSLLDDLTRLRELTRAPILDRDLSNAWENEIKIQVPESELSIGEIDRLLKRRFGHDVQIDGDLVQTESAGLALTVRGRGILPKTFEGTTGDLGALTSQAAAYIYERSQPGSYAWYLVVTGRHVEAIEFSKTAYNRAPPEERPLLLNARALASRASESSAQEAIELYRAALRLDPAFWVAYNNIMFTMIGIGEEEKVCAIADEMTKAAHGRPGKAGELWYRHCDGLMWNLQAERTALYDDVTRFGDRGQYHTSSLVPALAEADLRLHDPRSAELTLENAESSADLAKDPRAQLVRALLSVEAGQKEKAASIIETATGATASADLAVYSRVHVLCEAAPIEEANSQRDKADAALVAGGRHVDCFRYKGDILDGRGDWAGAQQAYQAAVDLAPDLPASYFSWGLALARHGDPAGAKVKLAAAHQHGPHWADPLKAWGDVLAGEAKWKEALAKYNEALKYAPAWKELNQAREVVAQHES